MKSLLAFVRRLLLKNSGWCSIHQKHYNTNVFKECPDCLKEEGPFFKKPQR